MKLFVKVRFVPTYIKGCFEFEVNIVIRRAEMRKQGVYMPLHEGNCEKCLKICDFLLLTVCSLILVEKWRLVSPT